MKFAMFAVFSLAVCFCFAQRPQVYCGRKLADTLAEMCYNSENSILQKKSIELNEVNHGNTWPWDQDDKALVLGSIRNKREGIIEECCDKPCSVNELLSYC